MKTAHLNIRIDPALLATIDRIREGLPYHPTRTSTIEVALREWIERVVAGYVPVRPFSSHTTTVTDAPAVSALPYRKPPAPRIDLASLIISDTPRAIDVSDETARARALIAKMKSEMEGNK